MKRLIQLGASDDDIAALETAIAIEPQIGAVIPGTGGLRKARFGYAGRGKRGGGRVIYYVVLADATAYLLVAYAKTDKTDLTAPEKKRLKTLVEELVR